MSETIQADPFTEAFRRLEELGDKAVPDNFMEETPPKAEETPPAEPPPAETPPVEEPPKAEEPPAETPPVEEPPKAEEPPKPAPSLAEDALAKIAEALSARGQPAEKNTPPQEQAAPELFTPEEKAALAKYEEDWPDVAKAEALRRRAEYQQVVGYVFQQVAAQLGPLLERVDAIAQRTHLSDLQSRVEDYETIREKVIDWVEKQPSYLRSAYTQVVEQGTAEEVADLIARYRKDAGGATAAEIPPPVAAPAKKIATELPPAAKQAAAALAPVSSKRSAVVQGVDPADFDAAFAHAAEQL